LIGEDRKQHHFVCDVKIRVARGQPPAIAHDAARHRQPVNLEWRAVLDIHALEQFEVDLQRLMIWIVLLVSITVTTVA
jgi:hypothetical protein